MKENQNKEIELIRELSQLMTKEKITKLKYKNTDLKLSIDKNVQSEELVSKQTQKTKTSYESVISYGNSARPDSPHYTDQMEMFVNRKMKAMTLNKEEIMKNAVKIYSPEVAP